METQHRPRIINKIAEVVDKRDLSEDAEYNAALEEHSISEAELEDIFERGNSKYNTSIKLTEEDQRSNIKVYCKEPYAQELYDKMKAYELENNISLHQCKDLEAGQIYEVEAKKISFEDKLIFTEEVNTQVEITIPFKEFSRSTDELTRGEKLTFHVMVYKVDAQGEFTGSERKCAAINYKKELVQHQNDNTWFEVSILKLIKGGYLAKYKDAVECFIPGSHAGANVIRDFNKLLNKTINVMVDNYDQSNDLFILSYKKYIKQSMPDKVTDLKFGHRYTGILTTYPLDFGIFVEFEDYYTGLIHSSEFENYNEAKKSYRSGDEIEFYVKNVTNKGKNYRIVLTLNENNIDPDKKEWDNLREQTENKKFDYLINAKNNSISIQIDDMAYEVSLRRKDLERNLNQFPQVRVFKVDPINRRLKFEFVEK